MINKSVVIPVLFILFMGVLLTPQSAAVSPPDVHFATTPVTTWYDGAPYEYPASISSPYNWSLRTNASLHMSDGMVANNTASQTIFGVPSTGKYWVNVTISYHNTTGATVPIIYQNFTLTVVNEPFIYSTPETFFYPDSIYNYTYEANQGSITNYSPGFTLNTTTHTLSAYLTNGTYSFFLTVSDTNGTYTQHWGASPDSIFNYSFIADLNGTMVNVKSIPAVLGVNNTSLFFSSMPVLTVQKTVYNYSFMILSTTSYSISTTSTNAPDAMIHFNGFTPVAKYEISMYDHGSLVNYTVVTSNANGTVTFAYNPAVMPLDPIFTLEPYVASNATSTVTFTESGLPAGATWYVNFTSYGSFESTSTSITMSAYNGQYSYTVSTTAAGYVPSPASGAFSANGAPIAQYIVFTKTTGSPGGGGGTLSGGSTIYKQISSLTGNWQFWVALTVVSIISGLIGNAYFSRGNSHGKASHRKSRSSRSRRRSRR